MANRFNFYAILDDDQQFTGDIRKYLLLSTIVILAPVILANELMISNEFVIPTIQNW